MLKDRRNFSVLLGMFLDTFFHLPTLVIIALISLIIIWKAWDASLYIGSDLVRLQTNQGSVTLDWADGCCDLDW